MNYLLLDNLFRIAVLYNGNSFYEFPRFYSSFAAKLNRKSEKILMFVKEFYNNK